MDFAGLVQIMALAMLVYAFLQQYLTKGITVGALKGQKGAITGGDENDGAADGRG